MNNPRNLLLDQNVASKASQIGFSQEYEQNITNIINNYFDNQQIWITSAFAFLEYFGISNKALPCPEIQIESDNEPLSNRIANIRNEARKFFESCNELQVLYIKNKIEETRKNLKNSQLAREIFESKAYYLEDENLLTQDLAKRLAWDYCQNETFYRNFNQEALDILITFLSSQVINRHMSPARFLISSWSKCSDKLLAAYQTCGVSASIKRRRVKVKADRLDLDIINLAIIGIPTEGNTKNITYQPVTIISEENPGSLLADLVYCTGIYRAAFKRLELISKPPEKDNDYREL